MRLALLNGGSVRMDRRLVQPASSAFRAGISLARQLRTRSRDGTRGVSMIAEMPQRLILGNTKPRGPGRSWLLERYTRTLFSEVNKKSPLSFCRLRRQTALLVRSMQTSDDDGEDLRRKTVHGTGSTPDGRRMGILGGRSLRGRPSRSKSVHRPAEGENDKEILGPAIAGRVGSRHGV